MVGIFRQLEYKLNWAEGMLIKIPPRNTSTRCSKCGHTCSENRTSQLNLAVSEWKTRREKSQLQQMLALALPDLSVQISWKLFDSSTAALN